jgi:hypothetical protein
MPTQPIDSPGRLNVILHGTFAFKNVDANAEGPGKPAKPQIKVLLPNLGHHAYRAGNWLGETQLLPGDYDLLGVKDDGTKKLDKAYNLLVKRNSNKPAKAAYATLNFPLPAAIKSMRVSTLPPGQFLNNADPDEVFLESGKAHVAALQVFTYDIKDEAELRLQKIGGAGHYWEPAFSGRFINLHIFSSEDQQSVPSFDVDDLQGTLGLLGSQVIVAPPLVAEEVSVDVLPDGVRDEETEDLAQRTSRMARLGRLLLQNGEPGQAWNPNESLGSNPPGCGGGGDCC